jgi:hypothetical protein
MFRASITSLGRIDQPKVKSRVILFIVVYCFLELASQPLINVLNDPLAYRVSFLFLSLSEQLFQVAF